MDRLCIIFSNHFHENFDNISSMASKRKKGSNLSEQSRGPTAGGAPKGSSSLWSRGRNERLEKLEDFLRGGDNFSGGEGEIFLVHFLFFGHHVSQKCHRMSQKKTSLRGLTRSGPEVWRAARKKNL